MDGNVLIAIVAGVIAIIAIVAFIARPRGAKEQAPPPPPPVRYKATLYNNGEVVRTMRATYASASESGCYVVAEGEPEHKYTIMGGCFVIESVEAPVNTPRTPASKYKVTLYDGGQVIREWYAAYASASKSGLYLQTEGATDYTIIGGTFLVEPLT